MRVSEMWSVLCRMTQIVTWVSGFGFRVSGSGFRVSGFRNQEPRTKNQAPRTKNQEPRTKHQAPKTKNPRNSFGPECFNWVKLGGPVGWVDTKHNTNQRRNRDAENR